MAGIGADARAVELTTWEMKKMESPCLRNCRRPRLYGKQPHLTLTTDEGRVLEGRFIIFGNGRKYGGPLNFFAEADNSDGLLDAVVFRHSITSIIGEFLMAAVHGGFHSRRSGSFEYIRMTGGSVTSAGQASCELDGDYAGNAPIRITRPGSLKVFVP